jgi:hypothetical protein
VHQRSYTTLVSGALLATGLFGLGLAVASGAIAGDAPLGMILAGGGAVGLLSLRTERGTRLFGAASALTAFVALLAGSPVVDGSDVARVVGASVLLSVLLLGLFTGLAPSCVGLDEAIADELPAEAR